MPVGVGIKLRGLRVARWAAAGLIVLGAIIAVGASGAAGGTAHAAGFPWNNPNCYSHTSPRDRSNPLDLSSPPGSNPLNGAPFSVDGPAKGAVAQAIARLMGLNPDTIPVGTSWASFRARLDSGDLSSALRNGDPTRRYQVQWLEHLADQPGTPRFSDGAGGGTRDGMFQQVQKILCHNLTADPNPNAVPIITTFFLYAETGYTPCPTRAKILSVSSRFKSQIDGMVAGIGNHPAVMLLEIDAIGAAGCMRQTARAAWQDDLRYEVDALASLPHTVVYLEAGYSNGNTPAYTARMLNAVARVGDPNAPGFRGFFTNDTHQNWTIKEIRWAEKISRYTHGAHYIVNTAQNGGGPTPRSNCVANAGAVGPLDTTNTQFPGAHDPHADAFLWTHPPAFNPLACAHTAGGLWVARAVWMAAHANGRLGPGFPSNPYWAGRPRLQVRRPARLTPGGNRPRRADR